MKTIICPAQIPGKYLELRQFLEGVTHRRRIDLEDKTKVVAYAWGAESLVGIFEAKKKLSLLKF